VLERVTYDEAALPRDPAWSSDGNSVVYSSNRNGSADLWKQRIGSPDAERLTSSEFDETQPAWSPDGQWIAFRSERNRGGLYVMRAGGEAQRMVSPFGYEPRWSPDGTHILFKRSAVLPNLPDVYVVGLDGRPPRPLRPDVLGQFRMLQAAWHPDGRSVSIWGTIGWTKRTFLTVPLSGGDATTFEISEHVRRGLADLSSGRFVWAPSRRFIYFEGATGDARNIWRITVDPNAAKWIAGPEPLTTGPGDATNVALSPDGKRLLLTTTSSRTRLWKFPFDLKSGRLAGEPYPVTDGSTGEVDFDVRGDGSTLVYRTVRAGRNELWEHSIVAGQQRLLLSVSDGRLMKPRWSPDGAQLAFSRHGARDDGLVVALLNRDGTGERRVTNPADFDMEASDWSRDGRSILGSCRFHGSDRATTCLVPLSDGPGSRDATTVRVIASDPDRNLYNQRFSPDQRWISFLAHDLWHDATSTVYVVPTSGGTWIPITEGAWFDDKPAWSPDGRAIYFVSNRTGTANVWGRSFDAASGTPVGNPFPVTSFQSARFALTTKTVQMDIAVTTTHLLLPMSESRSDIWMLDAVDR
jgi:Tol biopolymer transport system component